jgi:hypothetical protein
MLSAGDPLEVESASALYLGQLEEWSESKAVVLVEHSIDRSRLQAFERDWA